VAPASSLRRFPLPLLQSIAVRKAVRDAPQTGPSGVIYISVNDVNEFSSNLCAQFKMRAAAGAPLGREPKQYETEPYSSWSILYPILTKAAMEFRDKHGRPMTLVIDNAHYILHDDPEFLDELQRFAKEEADAGNLRLVFISSDFAVVTHMQQHSAWSRSKTMEMEGMEDYDIKEEAAIQYLTTKLGWGGENAQAATTADAAEYIVKNITGTRFGLLNEVDASNHNTVEKAKAWERKEFLATKDALKKCNIKPGHPLFGHMLDVPGQRLDSEQLEKVVGLADGERDCLVKKNVLAAHTDMTYTCAARHVVGTFKALRRRHADGEPAAAASSSIAQSPPPHHHHPAAGTLCEAALLFSWGAGGLGYFLRSGGRQPTREGGR
jgi:hypothetical protein